MVERKCFLVVIKTRRLEKHPCRLSALMSQFQRNKCFLNGNLHYEIRWTQGVFTSSRRLTLDEVAIVWNFAFKNSRNFLCCLAVVAPNVCDSSTIFIQFFQTLPQQTQSSLFWLKLAFYNRAHYLFKWQAVHRELAERMWSVIDVGCGNCLGAPWKSTQCRSLNRLVLLCGNGI